MMTYGCERADCTEPWELKQEPSPLEREDPSFTAEHGPTAAAAYAAAVDRIDRRICFHEAAHAVLATIWGWPPTFAISFPTPHVRLDRESTKTLDAALMTFVAGKAGEACAEHRRALPPDQQQMERFFAKARAGEAGACDECLVARTLTSAFPTEDDDALARRWREHSIRAADALDDVFTRSALLRVARALQEHRRLDRSQIEALIGDLSVERSRPTADPENLPEYTLPTRSIVGPSEWDGGLSGHA